MNLSIKLRTFIAIGSAILLFIILSITLSHFDDIDILFVWWLALFSLLPIVFLTLRIKYVCIKTISLLTLATQSISSPAFYIYKDDFYWDKPFEFNLIGAYEIFLKVFLFNFFLVIFAFLYKAILGNTEFKKK